MSNDTSQYEIGMVRGLPAGIFGEAYVITTGACVDRHEYISEYFILTQRPSSALHWGAVSFFANDFPEELGTIDVKFALEQALHQAELKLFNMLESRGDTMERPDIAFLPYELKPTPSPLVSCWMRKQFTAELMEIRQVTKCSSLSRSLSLLRQISVSWRAG